MKRLFVILCVLSLLIFPVLSGCGGSKSTSADSKKAADDKVKETPKADEQKDTVKAPAVAEDPNYNLYDNKTYGFKMLYPKDWTKQEGALGTVVAFLAQPNEKGFRANVNVVIRDIPTRPITMDQYMDLNIQQLKQVITEFNLISSEKITVDKLPGYKMVYTGKMGQLNLKWMQVFTIKEKSGYAVTYTYSIDRFDEAVPLANKMIESLSINNK